MLTDEVTRLINHLLIVAQYLIDFGCVDGDSRISVEKDDFLKLIEIMDKLKHDYSTTAQRHHAIDK